MTQQHVLTACRADEPGVADTMRGVLPGPDHVYLHSGEFHLEAEDLRIPGRGIDFVWARKYRSRWGPTTAIGNGWDFSYNLRVERAGTGVTVFDGNTRADRYTPGVDGNYVAPEFFTQGKFAADGSFTLTHRDGGTWVFLPLDGSPRAGKIERIVDRNGNRLAFAYTAGRLTTITDTLDRRIQVAYDAQGRIASVVDESGRRVTYAYYTDPEPGGSLGDLKSATSPAVTGTPHGNDFPLGKTTTYRYSEGTSVAELDSNLIAVTDPKGQTWLRVEYGADRDARFPTFDRVTRLILGDPNDIIDVRYEVLAVAGASPETLTFVNDRNGAVSEYTSDGRSRCTHVRTWTGFADPDQPTTRIANRPGPRLRSTDPAYFDLFVDHNDDALPVRITYPGGNQTLFKYEGELDRRCPRTSCGNLVRRVRTPGTHVPAGDQTSIVETFACRSGVEFKNRTNFVTRYVRSSPGVTGSEYVEELTYDGRGNRVRTVLGDPTVVHDFGYNAFGQLTLHRHPANASGWRREDALAYFSPTSGPAAGYLESITLDRLGLALVTRYERDRRGNAVREVDPRGNDVLRVFNALDQCVREESPLVSNLSPTRVRYRTDHHFDANDNVVRIDLPNVDENGRVAVNAALSRSFEHDVLNQLTAKVQEVDANRSIRTEFAHDGNRNLILHRRGEATNGRQPDNVVAVRFDERNLEYRRTKAASGRSPSTIQYDYDANGNPVREHQGLERAPRVSESLFDGYDRRVRTSDPMGNVVEVGFDPHGNPTRRRVSGEINDQPGATNNVLMDDISFVYDSAQRLLETRIRHFDPETGGSIGDGVSRETCAYSPDSQVVAKTDDNGHVERFTYDTAHRLSSVTDAAGNVKRYSYDRSSNVIEVVSEERSDQGRPTSYSTTYQVDELGRRTRSTDSVGQAWSFAFDSRHNLTRRVDPLGNVITKTFDGLDRLIATTSVLTADGTGRTQPVGAITVTQAWDDDSRLLEQTDARGNRTSYQWDALDRLVAVVDGNGAARTLSYDVQGNLESSRDQNGTLVTKSFDALDRIAGVTVASGRGVAANTTFERYEHDGLSRVTRAANDVSTIVRRYDSLSTLTLESQNGYAFRSTHDGARRRTRLVYPSGRTLDWTYDGIGRMKTLSSNGAAFADWSYEGRGQVAERNLTTPRLRSTVSYDGARRVARMTAAAGAALVDDRRFTWDAAYNRTGVEDLRTGRSVALGYDSRYRLIDSVERDASQRVIGNSQYQLDATNNRVSVSGSVDPGRYAMDLGNGDAQRNLYTATSFDVRRYDLNGNAIEITDGRGAAQLAYDFANRLTEHRAANGTRTRFDYDVYGRLVRKVVDAGAAPVTTWQLYDEWNLSEQRDGGGAVVATFVWGLHLDDLLGMRRLTTDTFFQVDNQGSVVAAVDSAGRVTERYTYGDFGAPTVLDPNDRVLGQSAIGSEFLFTGQRYDFGLGHYYYKTRWQDPRSGRFLSPDRIGTYGDPHNLGSSVAYVGNNPSSLIDPMGENWKEDLGNWLVKKQEEALEEGDDLKFWFYGKATEYSAWALCWWAGKCPGNPGPDDGTTPADVDMLMDLARQHGGALTIATPWGKTWLGSRLNGKGKGLDPVHNPAGFQEDFGAGGGGSGGGFMPNGGSVTQQLKGKRGKGGDDGDDGDSPDRPEDGGFWGADMPGPPELVNPAPMAWPASLAGGKAIAK